MSSDTTVPKVPVFPPVAYFQLSQLITELLLSLNTLVLCLSRHSQCLIYHPSSAMVAFALRENLMCLLNFLWLHPCAEFDAQQFRRNGDFFFLADYSGV